MGTRRPIWRYGLFQIPALLLGVCLSAAGITYFLRLGCYGFWTPLFLGLAWVSLMWMLVMPIDVLLRFQAKLRMAVAGRVAIFQAIFWTVVVAVFLNALLPQARALCALPLPSRAVQISLDWSRWRANIWNEMFFSNTGNRSSAPIGSEADFSFVVTEAGQIKETKVVTTDPELESYVRDRIDSLVGESALNFVPNTRRDEVLYESSIKICDGDIDPECGDPADPDAYPDTENYQQ